jgi:glucan phosphoethanolaminetransferase (alkaline phosphatase superfamily)
MRLEIFVFGVTAFFIYNAYTDGKYTKMLLTFKKYYTMIFYAILGVGVWLLLKRNPQQAQKLLFYTNNVVKYLPIDKSSVDMLTPIIDFTNQNSLSFMEKFNDIEPSQLPINNNYNNNNNKQHKRVVSETKKKYIASQQNWTCGHCQKQLDHTFEIDHKIRLEYGGDNEVTNLIALCRNCHGKKTAKENM